jgi:hypothetical protein
VCLDTAVPAVETVVRILPCNHVQHACCMEKWGRAPYRTNICPACRGGVEAMDIVLAKDVGRSPPASDSKDNESDKGGDCPICLEPLHGSLFLALMTCGHAFHLKCLTQWHNKSEGGGPERKTCPYCRTLGIVTPRENPDFVSGKKAPTHFVQMKSVQSVQSVQSKPVQSKPAQVKPIQTKPVQAKPIQTKVVAKPAQTKPVQTKPAQAKPAQTKPVQTKPVQTKPAQTKQPSALSARNPQPMNNRRNIQEHDTRTHGRSEVIYLLRTLLELGLSLGLSVRKSLHGPDDSL